MAAASGVKIEGLGPKVKPRRTGKWERNMPHVIVEYSSNLDGAMDVQGLLNALHQAMIDSGAAPLPGIRTRASDLRDPIADKARGIRWPHGRPGAAPR